MFYSHEILTSQKGGLATVWLLATVGSTVQTRKITRKTILDVNVPRTCDIIVNPEVPMALRLQSNLLYGVSRVFLQQSGYLLTDAQVAQTNMRNLLKAVRTSELDPEAGRGRPDQLVIQDDPNFSPDFHIAGVDIDLAALDMSSAASSRKSSILSRQSLGSSRSSQHGADVHIPDLQIPSPSIGSLGDLGGFKLPSEHSSTVQRNERLGRLFDDDEAFNFDPGFTIDAEGNLVEEPARESVDEPKLPQLGKGSEVSPQVRQDLQSEQGKEVSDKPAGLEDDFPIQQLDDGPLLPEQQVPSGVAHNISGQIEKQASSSRDDEEEESSDYAHAPQQRVIKHRTLPVDERMELRNVDLASWRDDYLTNMADAQRTKQHHQAHHLAKKNAALWVSDLGIAGVGKGIGQSSLKSPLDMFSGASMMEMLTGVKQPRGKKRSHGDLTDGELDSDGQRKVARGEEEDDFGRGGNAIQMDDDLNLQTSDDIEIGRRDPTPLVDDPTFPWNTTASAVASRQGSSIARSNVPGGLASSHGRMSVAGPSSAAGPLVGSLDRRASRVPSASPLVGRGAHRFSSLELPQDEVDLGPSGIQYSDDAYQAFEDESFQLHGPGAGVSTQVQAESQWIEATLDREAHNFLDFLKEEIKRVPGPEAGDEDEEDELSREMLAAPEPRDMVEFGQLLPPQDHSAIVAAQALHHVLALATKNLVKVEQEESFGPIKLGVVEKDSSEAE